MSECLSIGKAAAACTIAFAADETSGPVITAVRHTSNPANRSAMLPSVSFSRKSWRPIWSRFRATE